MKKQNRTKTSDKPFGIQPAFEPEIGFSECFIQSPVEVCAQAFSERVGAIRVVPAAHTHRVQVRGLVFGLLQYSTNSWTQLTGPDITNVFDSGVAQFLSSDLGCHVVFWYFEDVSCSLGYELYLNGKLLERFSSVEGKSAKFTSKRRTAVKVQHGKEMKFIDKTFSELGILYRLGFEWDAIKSSTQFELPANRSEILNTYLVDVPSGKNFQQ